MKTKKQKSEQTIPNNIREIIEKSKEGAGRIRKISNHPVRCNHPDHNPPKYISLPAGTYEYTCPACGRRTVFEIPDIRYQTKVWSAGKPEGSKELRV